MITVSESRHSSQVAQSCNYHYYYPRIRCLSLPLSLSLSLFLSLYVCTYLSFSVSAFVFSFFFSRSHFSFSFNLFFAHFLCGRKMQKTRRRRRDTGICKSLDSVARIKENKKNRRDTNQMRKCAQILTTLLYCILENARFQCVRISLLASSQNRTEEKVNYRKKFSLVL